MRISRSKQMKCKYCGTNLAAGATECPVCGKAVEAGPGSSFQLKYTSRAAREEQDLMNARKDPRQQPDPYGLYSNSGFPGQGAPGGASPGPGNFGTGPAGSSAGGQMAFPGGQMSGFGNFNGQVDDRTGFQNPSFGKTDAAAIKKQKRKRGFLIFLIILELVMIAGTLVFFLLDPFKLKEKKVPEPPYANNAVDPLAENYVNYLGVGDFTQPLMEGCGGETANEAYGKVVRKLEGQFGAIGESGSDQEGYYLTGVSLLKLVDLDHDGIDELLAVCNEDGTKNGLVGYIFFYEGGEVYRCFRAESMVTAWMQNGMDYMYVDLKDDGAKTLLYIGGQLEEDKSELECFVEVIQGNSALAKSTTLGPVSRIDGYKTEYRTAKAERDRCFSPFTVTYDDVYGMRAVRAGTDSSITSWCFAGDSAGLLEDAKKTTKDTKGTLGL